MSWWNNKPPHSYSLSLYSAPATEPVSRAEAAKHLELDPDDAHHGPHIDRLVTAARQHVEARTNRQIVTATWDLTVDAFPILDEPLLLPKAPLQSVTSITYTDSAGASQTLSTSIYKVLTGREPGEVHLKYGQTWPTTYEEPGVVVVRYVAGYGAASAVPEGIKAAILLLVGHWFENREAVVTGTIATQIPMAVESLLQQYSYGDDLAQYGHV